MQGKVAIVTGGTSGIGARTAELFVENGASVVIAGRRRKEGEALAAKLGDKAVFQQTDVLVARDVELMVGCAIERFGRLDCLFNNAGSPSHTAGIVDFDAAKFDEAIAIHVRSALLGMKYAAARMLPNGSGSIINMASINGHRAGYAAIAYSTAKAAVIHMTRCVAVELGEAGIRVNSISPGPIVTGIFGKAGGLSDAVADQEADRMRSVFASILPSIQPIRRIGSTDDIAQAVLFLASDESALINGHDLVVDGGVTAGRPFSVMRDERKRFAQAFIGT